MSTVSYIIAAYRGRRMGQESIYDRDRDHYLRRHLQILGNLRHSLSEIIVVLNEDGHAPIDLPTAIGSTPVRVFQRPNKGLSYGAFAHGIENVANSEYVILAEDDYAMTIDDFDRVLVERIESRPKPGFLCGAVECRPDGYPLGGTVFFGIASTNATREILKIGYDGAPIVRDDNSRDTGWYSQVAWSRMYMVAGYSLFDWLDDDLGCATWVSENHEAVWYDVDARPGQRREARSTSVNASTPARRSKGVVVLGRHGQKQAPKRGQPARPEPTLTIPPEHTRRRSPIVPQQALDMPAVTVLIAGQRYRATLGADGRLR